MQYEVHPILLSLVICDGVYRITGEVLSTVKFYHLLETTGQEQKNTHKLLGHGRR